MTVHADIEGAAEIARIAAGFDWTWTLDDVPRLCAIAGWQVVGSDVLGPILSTGLDIARSESHVFTDRGEARQLVEAGQDIERISLYVADLVGVPDLPPHVDVEGVYRLVSDRLVAELGSPTRQEYGSDAETVWELSKVVVTLYPLTGVVSMGFVNPFYEEWLEEQAASGEPY